jgi:anthranilate phosphoribosyltransferase
MTSDPASSFPIGSPPARPADAGEVRAALARLVAGQSLSEPEAASLFAALLSGAMDQTQIGALLALLASRGPTIDELVGGARVMRAHVTPVPSPAGAIVIDTCGTGGAPKAFNISTAAAIVAAAVRAPGSPRVYVAKHGNRSRTGRGSAEVLAALGVAIDAPPAVQARCLERAGVCFSFAIHHHPAMKHAAEPRRSLGFPTIFNLLGPLTNPAGARRQLLGVSRPESLPLVAGALARLGTERALVVHGAGGLDELSTLGPTRAIIVDRDSLSEITFDPAALGLRVLSSLTEIEARDAEDSARIIRDVLAGAPGPHREIVLLNAGAAILASGICEGLPAAIDLASRSIDSGEAARTLALLAECSKG